MVPVYISIKHNLMVEDFPFIVIHFTSLVDNPCIFNSLDLFKVSP